MNFKWRRRRSRTTVADQIRQSTIASLHGPDPWDDFYVRRFVAITTPEQRRIVLGTDGEGS